ncbi:hypothetical protein DIV22_22470 [Escherichia coli]|uniref:Uncharacterized protein n=1 Tax=Escherichia coli TaxID=562 RepID=A0A2W8IEF3_ECOLX|nr:hypothetical protein DIV22_22470 [Escherichia coli]
MKHDTREAEDVLDVAVAIAEADGEIEPEERKVLEEIVGAGGWGAGLRHYGIAVAGDKKKQPA